MRLLAFIALAAASVPAVAAATGNADVEPRMHIAAAPRGDAPLFAALTPGSQAPSAIVPAVAPGASGVTVALTLDACMGAVDDRILGVLVEKAIPATIFVTHRWLTRNPAALAVLLAHP